MRTAYVVLGLLMLSAASSYGFELGVGFGVRNIESTSTGRDPGAPMLSLAVGRKIVPALPFRIEAVVSAWQSRIAKTPYDFIIGGGLPEDGRPYHVDQPGIQLGGRALVEIENLPMLRRVHPQIGMGLYWATDRAEHDYDRYWRKGWGAEGLVGLAIPLGYRGNVLLQYGMAGDISADIDEGTVDNKDVLQFVTLGYRFSVGGAR